MKIAQTTDNERSIDTVERARYIKKVSLFAINVKDIFMGLKEAAPRLHDNGQVLNLSSSVTRLILSSYGLYSGTKAAV